MTETDAAEILLKHRFRMRTISKAKERTMFANLQLATAFAALLLASATSALAQTGPYGPRALVPGVEYVPPFKLGSDGLIAGGPYNSGYWKPRYGTGSWPYGPPSHNY